MLPLHVPLSKSLSYLRSRTVAEGDPVASSTGRGDRRAVRGFVTSEKASPRRGGGPPKVAEGVLCAARGDSMEMPMCTKQIQRESGCSSAVFFVRAAGPPDRLALPACFRALLGDPLHRLRRSPSPTREAVYLSGPASYAAPHGMVVFCFVRLPRTVAAGAPVSSSTGRKSRSGTPDSVTRE